MSEEIEKTCENCRYEDEDMEGTHCRHCIHNAKENFEPKEVPDDDLIFKDGLELGYEVGYNKAIDDFANTLIPRLTDAIYQKDVASMTNLINDVARELKAGGKNE